MKIALVHDHLNQIGGAEMVLKNISECFGSAPIYSLIYDKKGVGRFLNDKKIVTSFIQRSPLGLSLFKLHLPLMPMAIESLNLKGFDLVFSDSSAFAKGVITGHKAKHVCYCHTPTRYLWSDSDEYIKNLDKKSLLLKSVLPLILSRLRQWDYLAAQRVDYFIANSKFVAKRIKQYYNRDSTVIYPPVEVDNYSLGGKKEDYFVMVSRVRPYKKIALAITAFNELKMPLKIIGTGPYGYQKKLRKLANRNIQFLGIVSEKQKARILSKARAFINPQEEDFGIAAVESMSAGTPVIAYKSGGALETVEHEKTGIFFDTQSWEALALAVMSFKHNEFDPIKIKEHAQKFSSKRFKAEIKKFIGNIAENKN